MYLARIFHVEAVRFNMYSVQLYERLGSTVKNKKIKIKLS